VITLENRAFAYRKRLKEFLRKNLIFKLFKTQFWAFLEQKSKTSAFKFFNQTDPLFGITLYVLKILFKLLKSTSSRLSKSEPFP
jgi:hypothetical protein